ncbi:hypothetical protein OC846_003587 [Tilletia horrida]|uniref:GH16 domain-containing protein n=1 Tax=Tilletia horrida TaxID=155126 RepID=A0AAN6GPW7_9BASI|nr:hypothetical protein OC846_003587 [Tilletia horrida]KAK0569590.1 hypothetical protein OC861_000770 [Tilletia horrida]
MSELPYQGEVMTFNGSGMVTANRINVPTEDITSARRAVLYDKIDEEGEHQQTSQQGYFNQPYQSPPHNFASQSSPPEASLSSPFGDANQVPAAYLFSEASSRSSQSVHSRTNSAQRSPAQQAGQSPYRAEEGPGTPGTPTAALTHPLDGSRRPRNVLESPFHGGANAGTGVMRENRARRPGFGLNASNFSLTSQAFEGLRSRSKVVASTVLPEGHVVPKPWLESKKRRSADRKAYWLLIGASLLGLAGVAAIIVQQVLSLPKTGPYCLILDENFDGDSINTDIWHHEMQTGGFGNQEFEWTTDSTNNSYVKDGFLHIVPTLTSDHYGEDAITNGAVLNLTASGQCTAPVLDDPSCAVVSNSSLGTVLPPIQSARLTTNFSRTIKYGRIEVRARMPTGDWIWPAVWMMPKNSVYGPWPASGEIDIFESTGNVPKKRSQDGVSKMTSTLHWGPTNDLDRWWKTSFSRKLLRNFYNSDFHTFGLEWTEEGIWTWEHSRAYRILSVKFDKGFWSLGQFPPTSPTNNSAVSDPWSSAVARGSKAAPFDQDFMLILNVAVGGTNGYFPDSEDKPWSNSGRNPRADFWATRSKWLPTWPTEPERRGMVVDYVKMWQQGTC